jgi:anti-sigma factor RsiW
LFDPAHEGSLDPGSPLRAEFDEHLSGCPDCSEGWSQWQQAMTALQGAAAGRASREETDAVLAAVERAAQRPAPGPLAHEAAFRHGLLLAAAQQDAGRRRRVAALLVAAASGAMAASVAFILCWPRAHGAAPANPQSSSPPVAAAPAPSPREHREPRPIVIDTKPLADVLRTLGERVHQQRLAPDALPPVGVVPSVAAFVPLPGEVLVSRADGQLSLTLAAASPNDVTDFRALVPPLLQLLSAPDEEVVHLAEARLESVRSQVEKLTGPAPADAPRKDSPRDWRRLLGLPPTEAPAPPPGTRWRSWWEAVEPLLPDLGGAT